MKAAVTSQNFRTITGHAGKTRRFIVFDASNAEEIHETGRIDLPKEMSIHEYRGQAHPLDDVDVVITSSCGDGFIRKMEKRGVRVMTTEDTDPLAAVKYLVAHH